MNCKDKSLHHVLNFILTYHPVNIKIYITETQQPIHHTKLKIYQVYPFCLNKQIHQTFTHLTHHFFQSLNHHTRKER